MMTESNKGRFKCADDAQAVWNMVKDKPSIMIRVRPFSKVLLSFIDSEIEQMAKALYQARLIHGSIYDEHGRVEDKDVAQAVWTESKSYPNFTVFAVDSYANLAADELLEIGQIRGTIFY